MAFSPKMDDSGIVENLVEVRRVAKTVKGGRTMRFAALMVVGDGKGRVGYGTGKAREVPEAIRKASEEARRDMRRVPLRNGRTLHHDTIGRFGAAKVTLRSAPAGTGIIAGGPMRAVFEALGVQDVVAKSMGSSNPNNMVKATFDAFSFFESPRMVSSRRNMKVSDILGKKLEKVIDNEEAEQAELAKAAAEKAAKEAKNKKADAKKKAPAKKKPAAKKSAKPAEKKPAAKAEAKAEPKADTKPAAKKADDKKE